MLRHLIMPLLLASCAPLGAQPIRIFVADKVVTMNPSQPEAEAVAVRGDRVVSVGSLAELEPWILGNEHEIDRRFAGEVLLPGFIDNHLHPYLAAVVLPMDWITPHPWQLNSRNVEATRGREAYLARLRELAAGATDVDEWLFAWGFHPLFHGTIGRGDLDSVSPRRPIVVWHRSFHEIFLNSKALETLGLEATDLDAHPGVDFEQGRFFETGLAAVIGRLGPILLAPERYLAGLAETREIVRAGGITTIADMGFGLLSPDLEWQFLESAWDNEETPFRTLLVPNAGGFEQGDPGGIYDMVEKSAARRGQRLRVLPKTVKLFADGAFYSLLMKLGPPGYIDGHHGEWLMEPEDLLAAARTFWEAGYRIHVHANGDAGIDVTLDTLATLLDETPRFDHRFTLHHFGYSRPDQSRRIAELGALVSANPFYLWALADTYAEHGLGTDRAAQMSRLGSLARSGVVVSLHSDFTMAPARPLVLAGVAATRMSASGRVWAPEEKLSRSEALAAITLDAAYALGMEREIGSIEAGKKADFAVLDRDPREVDPTSWSELSIVATVFEGRVFETDASE